MEGKTSISHIFNIANFEPYDRLKDIQIIILSFNTCLASHDVYTQVDAQKNTLKVEAGITLTELNEDILPKHGLGLSVLVLYRTVLIVPILKYMYNLLTYIFQISL